MGTKWTWQDAIPGLLTGLLFINCSRKFGFGLWVFFATNYMAKTKVIAAEGWALGMVLSAVLVGGGTVADALMEWVKARFGVKANAAAPSA